jgi:glycosyltransferase involved in cell wall biosynthesis
LINYRKTNIAIALGQEQVPILKKILGHDRINVIPHGVDTNYFKPNDHVEQNDKIVLIVGNWMRDFELARTLAEIFYTRDKDIKFIVVSLESNRFYFKDLKNVSFFSKINDDELLQLYNKAQILFLPLKGAIANNALLEAMSCNLPILISNIPTLHHFKSIEGIFFFDNKIDEIVSKISQLIIDNSVIKKKGALREFAQQYSWEQIAELVQKEYI